VEPLAFLDVHYFAERARAACVVASCWSADVALESQRCWVDDIAPYVPGRFYERELPPLLAVLGLVTTRVQTLIVDSYVELTDSGAPGLGAHLYEHFHGRYAVVGIAKTAFRGSSFAVPVRRGGSERPLYVTARGVDPQEAAREVAGMHGKHRIPTLLKLVDRLARCRDQTI
jgi:deoxyribonuclease V